MEVIFDPPKDIINRRDHKISLADAEFFELGQVFVDDRKDYGETRYRAYGWIDGRLHMMAFTVRGDVIRPISLRKANKREVRAYGQ